MADHLERDALARVGQPRAAVRLVLEQLERRELLHHRRRGRGRHRLVLRERADRHAAVLGLELVDALQVVLDRLAQFGPRHRDQGNVVGRADPRGTQRRPRRRVHGLGARGRDGRHARARVRAGRLRHPDPERVGARGPPRGDGALGRRLPVRRRPLRPAAARRVVRRGLRPDRRRARAARPARCRDRHARSADDRDARPEARARRRRAHARPAVRRGARRSHLRPRRGGAC